MLHPAEPDQNTRSYSVGTVVLGAKPKTLRRSLTFQGMDSQEGNVEMDWYVGFGFVDAPFSAVSGGVMLLKQQLRSLPHSQSDDVADTVGNRCLIGPVPNGKNFVPVPNFRMDQCVAVGSMAGVEGNTEVYAMARTSGYSLGFTSDVPGVQKIRGQLRREWTARQYSASSQAKDRRVDGRSQTLKQWVTSGMGVPGDSGAWLMRRSDNAVIGMIWARNHTCGPLDLVRLAHFTPMVDVFADVQERKAYRAEVSLPAYSAAELARAVQDRRPEEAVEVDPSQDPWNVFAREAIREHHQVQEGRIQSHFVGTGVPASGVVLDMRPGAEEPLPRDGPRPIESSVRAADPPTTPPRSDCVGSISTLHSRNNVLLGLELKTVPDPSLPELSASSSIGSGSSMADEHSEVASTGVRIVDELDIEEGIMDAGDPIRAKASYPELLKRVEARSGFVLS